MAFTAGSRLGPYEILAPAGAGGMGEVYRARATLTGAGVVCALVWMSLAGSLTAQSSGQQTPRQRFETEISWVQEWAALARRHDPGQLDDAVTSMGAWPSERLERTLRRFQSVAAEASRLSPGAAVADRMSDLELNSFSRGDLKSWFALTDEEARTRDLASVVARAVVLHGDVAMLRPAGQPGPAPRTFLGRPLGSVSAVVDGRSVAMGTSTVHWRAARFVMDMPLTVFKPTGGVHPLRQPWYEATSAFLLGESWLSEALEHVEYGLRSLPGSAPLLLQAGAAHETLASAPVQAIVDAAYQSAMKERAGSLEIAQPTRRQFGAETARVELVAARKLFDRAVSADPALVEASVRLGHVLSLVGDLKEAEKVLIRAAAATREPVMSYYAQMFLGSVEEKLGNEEAALAAFQRAAEIYPSSQSARIALSALMRRRGQLSESTTLLESALASPAPTRTDPWWTYETASGRESKALITALYRRLVPRPPS